MSLLILSILFHGDWELMVRPFLVTANIWAIDECPIPAAPSWCMGSTPLHFWSSSSSLMTLLATDMLSLAEHLPSYPYSLGSFTPGSTVGKRVNVHIRRATGCRNISKRPWKLWNQKPRVEYCQWYRRPQLSLHCRTFSLPLSPGP